MDKDHEYLDSHAHGYQFYDLFDLIAIIIYFIILSSHFTW